MATPFNATDISGSITRTTAGLSYLVAGNNTTITSASNGQVTIASIGGGGGVDADEDASYVVIAATASLPNERVLTAGTGISLADGGAGAAATLAILDSVVATVSGTHFTGGITSTGTGSFEGGMTGSLTKLTDGTSYLEQGSNITLTSQSNGSILIEAAAGLGNTLDQAYDQGGAGAGRTITVDTGAVEMNGSTGDTTLVLTGSAFINGKIGLEDDLFTSGSLSGSILSVATIQQTTGSIQTAVPIIIGQAPATIGTTSVLVGEATAIGNGSVNIGNNVDTGASSTAIGENASATGASSVAVGRNSDSGTGTSVVVIGHGAASTGASSVMIGTSGDVAQNGVAIGNNASSNTRAVAIGTDSVADTGGIAIGRSANTINNNSLVMGSTTDPISAIAIGSGSGGADNLLNASLSGTMSLMGDPKHVPLGSDVQVYITGTTGTRTTSTRGTTVVAGDAVISGTLLAEGRSYLMAHLAADQIIVGGPGGSGLPQHFQFNAIRSRGSSITASTSGTNQQLGRFKLVGNKIYEISWGTSVSYGGDDPLFQIGTFNLHESGTTVFQPYSGFGSITAHALINTEASGGLGGLHNAPVQSVVFEPTGSVTMVYKLTSFGGNNNFTAKAGSWIKFKELI